jgi:hypothetical protein
VHNPLIENDFLPLNKISNPTPRILDDSNKMCMGYGLSMFDTKENASLKYRKLFKKTRELNKDKFKIDKGTYGSIVNLGVECNS